MLHCPTPSLPHRRLPAGDFATRLADGYPYLVITEASIEVVAYTLEPPDPASCLTQPLLGYACNVLLH